MAENVTVGPQETPSDEVCSLPPRGFTSTLRAPLSGIFHLFLCVLRATCVLVPSLGSVPSQTMKPRCPVKLPVLWDPSGVRSNDTTPPVGVCSPLPNPLEHQAGARPCLPVALWLGNLHRYHPVKE